MNTMRMMMLIGGGEDGKNISLNVHVKRVGLHINSVQLRSMRYETSGLILEVGWVGYR